MSVLDAALSTRKIIQEIAASECLVKWAFLPTGCLRTCPPANGFARNGFAILFTCLQFSNLTLIFNSILQSYDTPERKDDYIHANFSSISYIARALTAGRREKWPQYSKRFCIGQPKPSGPEHFLESFVLIGKVS